MLQELQVGDRNASLPMPRTYTQHKLTGLRNPSPYTASMVCRRHHHPDLSSRLPPANAVLLSEQVKYPPASGPQHLLFSQIENSPSNAASLCSNVTLTERPSHRAFINGNPTHSSGPWNALTQPGFSTTLTTNRQYIHLLSVPQLEFKLLDKTPSPNTVQSR